jgi:hypothetical protein
MVEITPQHPYLLDETTITLEEYRRLRDEADVPIFVHPHDTEARKVA